MLALGHLIIGMHLYGEILTRIYNLGKKRQLTAIFGNYRSTEHCFSIAINHICQGLAFKAAISNHRLTTSYTTHHPSLCAPNQCLEVGFKNQWITFTFCHI